MPCVRFTQIVSFFQFFKFNLLVEGNSSTRISYVINQTLIKLETKIYE